MLGCWGAPRAPSGHLIHNMEGEGEQSGNFSLFSEDISGDKVRVCVCVCARVCARTSDWLHERSMSSLHACVSVMCAHVFVHINAHLHADSFTRCRVNTVARMRSQRVATRGIMYPHAHSHSRHSVTSQMTTKKKKDNYHQNRTAWYNIITISIIDEIPCL